MTRDEEKGEHEGNKITLSFIVNGKPTSVDANVNAPLQTAVQEALRLTGNATRPIDDWTVSAGASPLDLKTKIGEFGFTAATVLSLALRMATNG